MKYRNKTRRRPGEASWWDKVIIFSAGVGVIGTVIYVFARDGIPPLGELLNNLFIRLAPAPSFLLIFFSCWYVGYATYDLVVRLRDPQATEEEKRLQIDSIIKSIKRYLPWYSAGVISLAFLYWWSPLVGLGIDLLIAIIIASILVFVAGILARVVLR